MSFSRIKFTHAGHIFQSRFVKICVLSQCSNEVVVILGPWIEIQQVHREINDAGQIADVSSQRATAAVRTAIRRFRISQNAELERLRKF